MKKDGDLSELISFLVGFLCIMLINAGIIYTVYSAYIGVKDGYTLAAFLWAITASFLALVLFSALRKNS